MGNKTSKNNILEVPSTVTNPNVRPTGIKYKKNEIFLTVNEQINLLTNSNGNIISSGLNGKFIMNTKLSGVPEIKIGLSFPEKEFDDVQFHQCVHTNNLDKLQKTILLNPPDGNFELLSYNMPLVKKAPIFIESNINKKTSSIIYTIILHGNNFTNNYPIKDISIIIPVPNDSNLIKSDFDIGTVQFQPENNSVFWTIDELKKKNNSRLYFEMGIPTLKNELIDDYEKKPIAVKFNVDFITNSGIKVKFIKTSEKSDKKYIATSWIKYCLQNGDYLFTSLYI